MAGMKIAVVGGRELAAKLRRLSGDVAGKALERALAAGGLEIVNEAKQQAPWKTGNLRRSLHVGGYEGKEEPTTGTDIGGNKHTANSAEVLVGTNVEYAAPVEFGPPGPGILGGRKPYLRPAIDTQKEQVAKTIGGTLRDLIMKAAR